MNIKKEYHIFMDKQKELVEIVCHVTPMINIKG